MTRLSKFILIALIAAFQVEAARPMIILVNRSDFKRERHMTAMRAALRKFLDFCEKRQIETEVLTWREIHKMRPKEFLPKNYAGVVIFPGSHWIDDVWRKIERFRRQGGPVVWSGTLTSIDTIRPIDLAHISLIFGANFRGHIQDEMLGIGEISKLMWIEPMDEAHAFYHTRPREVYASLTGEATRLEAVDDGRAIAAWQNADRTTNFGGPAIVITDRPGEGKTVMFSGYPISLLNSKYRNGEHAAELLENAFVWLDLVKPENLPPRPDPEDDEPIDAQKIAADQPRVLEAGDPGDGLRGQYAPPTISAHRRVGEIKIDGKSDDWPEQRINIDKPSNAVHGVENWEGPNDLSAATCIAWDEDNLYFWVDVTDDKIVLQNVGKNFWQDDHVEIWLYAGGVSAPLQFGFAPGEKGIAPQVWVWYPTILSVDQRDAIRKRVEFAVVNRDGGYVVEARIPVNVFGVYDTLGAKQLSEKTVLRVDVDPGDRDAYSKPHETLLALSPMRQKDQPTTFAVLELKPAGAVD